MSKKNLCPRKHIAVLAVVALLVATAILEHPSIGGFLGRLSGQTTGIAEASSGGSVTYRTVTFEQDGDGSVYVTPPGATVTMPGQYVFVNGSVVQLEAIPETDYEFDHWEGSVTGTENPKTVTVGSSFTCRPVFLPVIRFATASATKNESETTYSITLTRRPSLRISAVGLSISGSAERTGPYPDYSASPDSSVTFYPLVTTETIDVTIYNDSIDEFDENVIFTLTSPYNAKIGTANTHELTIVDNDPVPHISFALPGSTKEESVSQPGIAVGVFTAGGMSTVSGRAITATISLSGDATSGADYIFSPAQVFIPKHTGSVNVPISLIDDNDVENTESVTLTLPLYPSNAQLGAQRTYVLTISDNDVRVFLYKLPVGIGTLTVSPDGTPITAGLPTDPSRVHAAVYPKDTVLITHAQEGSGQAIRRWTGDYVLEIDEPMTEKTVGFPIFGHTSLTAEYAPYYNVTTQVLEGAGTISVSPNRSKFFEGQEVEFTAACDPNVARLGTWGGALTAGDDTPRTIVMGTSNIHATATFIARCRITTLVEPFGSGSVSVANLGDRPQDTGPLFDVNTLLRLTAQAGEDWAFDYWSVGGDLISSANPYDFNIASNVTYTAHFIPKQVLKLTVPETGFVRLTVDTIGGAIVGEYHYSPSPHYILLAPGDYWLRAFPITTEDPVTHESISHMFTKYVVKGEPDVTSPFYEFTMVGPMEVEAQFARAIGVFPAEIPQGSGWVIIDPEGQGINADVYPEGMNITATPLPVTGYRIVRWGDDTPLGDPPYARQVAVSVHTNDDLKAYFDLAAPEAQFSATPTSGIAPLEVTFTDESDGNATEIDTWDWNFGDGGMSSEQNPVHIYEEPGTYTVSLTVTNEDDSDTAEKEFYITVISPVVGQWPFDEPSGGIAADLGPDGLDLTLVSPEATQGVAGIVNYALLLSPGAAIPAEYDVGDAASEFDLSNEATAMAWFKPNGSGADQTLLSKGDPSSDFTGYEVVVNPAGNANKGLMLRYGDGTSVVTLYSDQITFAPGKWYHLGVVFKDGTASFYVNGVPAGTTTPPASTAFAPNLADFAVGVNGVGTNPLNGYLDELILQRFALTQGDVQDEFGKVTHTLTDTGDPDEGHIDFVPSGGVYLHGQTVTLTPVAEQDYVFKEWGGTDGASVDTFDVIEMDSDKEVAAVFVQKPIIDFTYTVNGLVVQFDGTCTNHNTGDLAWSWNFGDGSLPGSQEDLQHTFANEGVHTVTLTVTVIDTPAAHSSVTKTVELFGPPKASIQVDYLTTEAPFEVKLTDVSIPGSGQSITGWEWTVDGQTTSGSPEITHTFDPGDTYSAALTVTQGDNQTDTATVTIEIKAGPSALFTAVPTSTNVDHYVTFTDMSSPDDGSIVEWRWNFGDGATATGKGPHTHVYAASGDFAASLLVRTDVGSSTSDPIVIHVEDAFSPTMAPDLAVTSVTGVTDGEHLKKGDTFTVGATVQNESPSFATPTGRSDALYLSLDTVPDQNDLKLESVAGGVIAGGGSASVAFATATIPDIAPGRYYLVVRADDANEVIEVDETDNTNAVAITVVDSEMTNE